ncbi:hypothetical protein ES332_A11G045900v1 [Gossypium tomentosum]|uniref:Uncharacterized protein n=1 Tax=Gossypium tomentosum TaxID=34277 RepID=A0A5D2N5D9_GOSTO|nr:hypothetical protein ES332_A11G045900v1 [Gossypium tomentosum]
MITVAEPKKKNFVVHILKCHYVMAVQANKKAIAGSITFQEHPSIDASDMRTRCLLNLVWFGNFVTRADAKQFQTWLSYL